MRRIISVLAVAALMAAMMLVAALPAFAQPPVQAPGCDEFVQNADPRIRQTPAFEAFARQLANLGGIGPCFAPHPGGRA